MNELYNLDGLLELPEDLRKQAHFLMWYYQDPDANGKRRKIPYYADGTVRKQNSTSVDRERLQPLATVLQALEKQDPARTRWGVGIAFSSLSEVTGVDYDWLVDSKGVKQPAVINGKIHPSIMSEIKDSYYEISPSGSGVHALFTGANHSAKFNGEGVVSPGDAAREVFGNSGFMTLTGRGGCYLFGQGLAAVPEVVATLLKPLDSINGEAPPPLDITAETVKRILFHPVCQQFAATYRPWLKVGMALHHQFSGDPEGLDIWDEWSQAYSGSTYNARELALKWETFSATGSLGGQTVTIKSVEYMIRQASLKDAAQFDNLESATKVVDAAIEWQASADRKAVEDTGAPAAPVIPPQLLDIEAFASVAKSKGYIVKGLIEKQSVGFIAGQPGAGKSFLALHLIDCIVQSKPFFGFEIGAKSPDAFGDQAPLHVAYVAAEGQSGVVKRLSAIATVQGSAKLSDSFPPTRVLFKPEAMQWMREDPSCYLPDGTGLKDYMRLALECRRQGIDLIIFDTHAACSVGVDENSNSEMQEVVSRMEYVKRISGATVMSIHHAPKNGAGLRGASALLGAADFVLEGYVTEAGYRRVRQVKAKDDALMPSQAYDLRQVVLADQYQPDLTDLSFDIATSCIVEERPDLGGEDGDVEPHHNRSQRSSQDHMETSTATSELRKLVREMCRKSPTGVKTSAVKTEFRRRFGLTINEKQMTGVLKNFRRNIEPLLRSNELVAKEDLLTLGVSFEHVETPPGEDESGSEISPVPMPPRDEYEF